MAHGMLHVMSTRCAACDLHTIAPWPLECTCWRQFAAQRGDCKKSRIAPSNVIIIIIIIINVVGVYMVPTASLTVREICLVSDGHYVFLLLSDLFYLATICLNCETERAEDE